MNKKFKKAIAGIEKVAKKYNFKLIEINYIDDDHTDCLWYGGTILHLTSKKLDIYLNAYGDVYALLDIKNDTVSVKDKNNAGIFYSEMSQYIKSDKALYKKIKNGSLTLENNNWLELTVWDKEKKSWIDEDAGLLDGSSILEEIENFENHIKWALDLKEGN